jgi:hypothetical protein
LFGGKLCSRAEHRGFGGRAPAEKVALQKPARYFFGAADHGRQTVEQVKLGDLTDFGRNRFYLGSGDECGDVIGDGSAGSTGSAHE